MARAISCSLEAGKSSIPEKQVKHLNPEAPARTIGAS